MLCKVKNGVGDPNPINLARNSGDIGKRTIVWKSLDRSYVIKVPPGLFKDHLLPEDCLMLLEPKKNVLVLLETGAELGSKFYDIFDPSEKLGVDTPPEIIVNDEGTPPKRKKKAAGKKRRKATPAKKASLKQPPVEKPA